MIAPAAHPLVTFFRSPFARRGAGRDRRGRLSYPKWRPPGNLLWVFVLAAAFLVLSGCAVGPNYRRPALNEPAAFRGETSISTNGYTFGDLPWWEVFHDPTLQKLVGLALTNNFDLRIAFTRVEQARALVQQARAGFFPQLNYGVNAGAGENISGGSPAPTGTRGRIFSVDAGASWEIDLWGRIRRLKESARAQYFATQEARHDVLTSIIAQVANAYFQLLALDSELEVAKRTTNSYGASLLLFNQRLQGGVASRLEASSARALLNSAAATIPSLELQMAFQENLISILLGQNPGPVSRGGSQLENQFLPNVPAGLPSALVERRPDIREAEQQLRSANAQVGVAFADFFPQLNLTGLLGEVGPELSAFTGGGSTAWAVASGLTGPLFQGGRISARYREAKAARDQFALQYQAALLNAFGEVSNALISRERLAEARFEQTRAVDAYRDAISIATERYRLGRSSYYEVLQEQQLLFPAENALVQIQLNQLLAMVQLYRTLGGGWQSQEPVSSPAIGR
jgi:multidrug efflux system outer membrane protein